MNAAKFVAVVMLASIGAGPVRAADEDGPALRAMFGLSSVELNEIPSCRGVGLTATDRTVGDFLGSILAQFAGASQEAPILEVRPTGKGDAANPEVEITFYRRDGEEEWKWGLAFALDGKTGLASRESVRCIVAG